MSRRYRKGLSLALVVPSVLISIATGVLGILTYTHNQEQFNRAGLISLIVGEMFILMVLPFYTIQTDYSLVCSIAITALSTLCSLGAGLYTLNISVLMENTTTISHPLIFKSFISLFVASLLFGGIALGSEIQIFNSDWEYYEDEEFSESDAKTFMKTDSRYRSNSDPLSLKEKMVSLKASAATLVATAGRNDDHITTSNTNTSKGNTNESLTGFAYNRNTTTDQTIPSYSIKKLSVINRSSSSVSISEFGSSEVPKSQSGTTLKSALFTPTLSRFKDVESSSKIMMLERDALKRIPSVLLPPHLKPHTNNTIGQERSGSDSFMMAHSSGDISAQYFKEDQVIEQIPRAHTLASIMPYFKENKGMRTISLEDYEKNYDRIQKSQLMGSSMLHKQPFNSSTFFAPPSEEMEDIALESEVCESLTTDIAPEQQPDDSTDEALKYLANAQGSSHNNEILKTAMDQTTSNFNLQDEVLSKTKSHSPHKSIFGHSRRGSQFSNKINSASLPGSPVRRAKSKRSPRKLGIKNLSLSSIVYKDEKSDIPNFSYVHELQSSPTKKTKDPQTPLMRTKTTTALKDTTNTTPDSNWSENSHRSVFPSEVIGEYDKEKWKTMRRLQLVDQEN